jgi:hypothetical protein
MASIHDILPPNENTLARLKDEFRHDPETGELFRRVGTLTIGKKTGYRRLVASTGENRARLVAHIIWFLEHDKWPTTMLDHINGDSLDNRLVNLREIHHGGNLANSKGDWERKYKLPIGVYPKRGKFQARINRKGRFITLGIFDTPEEAEKVFIAEHLAKFGEHSRYFDGKRKQRF